MAKCIEASSYERAVEGILNHIVACGMQPGDSLPPERELCDGLGVSRTTLRSAIAHLVNIHVIERRQGSGNYLHPRRPTVQLDDLSGFSKIIRSVGGEPSSRVTVARAADREAEQMELASGDFIFFERGIRMGPDADSIEYYRIRYSPRHFRDLMQDGCMRCPYRTRCLRSCAI